MEYLYDAEGNWVEQRVFAASAPDGPSELSSLYRRTLEYFN